MADVWPVECRVLLVPQQEGPVVVAVQQSVFLHATQDKAQESCICSNDLLSFLTTQHCAICCQHLSQALDERLLRASRC